MPRKVLVINGHPDPSCERFASALAGAYVAAASKAGHQIRRIDVGALQFDLIRTQAEFTDQEPPQVIREAQESIAWADHLVIIFPLWLGTAPAVLKGFLEQVFRYGFALSRPGEPIRGLLRGRSARLIVTMGMPAPAFRWIFGGFGVRTLERGLLWISGVSPIRHTILGGVDGEPARRRAWLAEVGRLGSAAT
jgi:putative NADPH-quinone reductase